MGLRRGLRFFIYVGCGAFATWLLLAVTAATLNIPNYGAKLADQTCNCKVPDYLVVYVKVGGLEIGLGVLIPALLFAVVTIFQIADAKSQRSESVKVFIRSFALGVVIAAIVSSALLLQQTPAQIQDVNISAQEVKLYPITVRLLNGTILSLESLSLSGRTVVIEFFLPTCPLCQLQLLELKKLLEIYGNEVICMLIVPNWYTKPIEELDAQKIDENMIVGYDIASATQYYGVDIVPTLLIIDPSHNKALLHRGLVKESEIITLLSTSGLPTKDNIGRTQVDIEYAAIQESSLVIYVEDYLEVELLQQLAEGFRAKYPNISVTILWPNCCGPTKMYWIPDVITGSDMSTLLQLKANGRLRVIKQALLEAFPDWAKDSEDFWVAQGIKIDVLVYNRAFIDNPPTSLAEILKMCDKVVIAKPDYTIKNAPFIALTELYGLEYWHSFQQSAALLAPLLKVGDIIASGERAITPYLPLAEYARVRKLNSEVSYFVPEEGVFVRLSWVALPSDSPHPNAAELWLHYVLSAEGQLLRQSIYHELSARVDVQKPEEYLNIIEAIRSGKVLQPNWSTYKDNVENYIKSFEKIFKRQ